VIYDNTFHDLVVYAPPSAGESVEVRSLVCGFPE